MITEQSTLLRSVKSTTLLIGAWVSFFVLQSVVSVALSPRRTASRTGILELELVLGVVWGLLSIIIIAWHRRLRASTTNLFGLMAAHLPGPAPSPCASVM